MTDICELKQALNNNNFDVSIIIGHRLKGNGETFGYPEISVIGKLLEEAGIIKNKKLILEVTEKLTSLVNEYVKKTELA